MSFGHLGLEQELLKAIPFETPTDIQEKSIPLILKGKDVIAGSATGSGKTLAFACGIIQQAVRGEGIQALVLVPTRELAQQVSDEFSGFSKFKHLNAIPVFGGVSLGPQIDGLRHSDVVIGTPGRVLDLLSRNALDLRRVRFLVLDEADRMLDMGFIDDVRKIIRHCPKDRQTMLFSATITHEVSSLSREYMNHPVSVEVDSYVDPKLLNQVYYDVIDDKLKFSLMVHLLKGEPSGLVMVFCNTQRTTDFIAKNLQKYGIDALAIHGGFTQAKRTSTMEKFHANKFTVLVCTDVAARGLDINNVSHVYNYDVPRDPKSYIHRIGRTARAGKEGIAITLLGSKDHEFFSAVLRNNDVKIARTEVPDFEHLRFHHSPQEDYDDRGGYHTRGPPRYGRNGGRPRTSGGGEHSSFGNRRDSGRSESSGGRFRR
jgi:ATP-dependent RNA helicase DeaD